MGNKGHSDPGLFGGYTHYDSNGHKTGHSDPGLFGGYTHYDSKGHKTGHSDPGLFGGYTHYDSNGHKTGHSDPGLFGGYTNYDSNGNKTGHSDPSLFGGYSHSDGCYVATCVYGSYDCPQVWTLRRFRDDTLGTTRRGRAFIRTYYAISPTVVKLFGNRSCFKKICKKHLDRMVNELNRSGVENTPYNDKNWRKKNSSDNQHKSN